MQISNNRPVEFYPAARLPVLLDSRAELNVPAIEKATLVVPVSDNQKQQAPEPVRSYILTQRQPAYEPRGEQVLPAALKQYQFIDNIPNPLPSGGRLLDEIV